MSQDYRFLSAEKLTPRSSVRLWAANFERDSAHGTRHRTGIQLSKTTPNLVAPGFFYVGVHFGIQAVPQVISKSSSGFGWKSQSFFRDFAGVSTHETNYSATFRCNG